MLFEAPGVWNSRANLSPATRINRGRLADFRRHVQDDARPEALFAELIASDRLFSTNVDLAYAEAWALCHYLMKKRPKEFVEYLKTLQRKPTLGSDEPEQRLLDFQRAFGDDLKAIDTELLKHVTELL